MDKIVKTMSEKDVPISTINTHILVAIEVPAIEVEDGEVPVIVLLLTHALVL